MSTSPNPEPSEHLGSGCASVQPSWDDNSQLSRGLSSYRAHSVEGGKQIKLGSCKCRREEQREGSLSEAQRKSETRGRTTAKPSGGPAQDSYQEAPDPPACPHQAPRPSVFLQEVPALCSEPFLTACPRGL